MSYTLTYSERAKGWQSFYSYKPEKMIGMNNLFYSFKNGALYRHNSDNVNRNNFYGNQYNSAITGIINEDAYSVKTFKTFSLDSNQPWDCTFTTDLSIGTIDADWFSLKEGKYFSHIRRQDNDSSLELRSAQGIGNPSSVDATDTSEVIVKFSFKIDSMVSVGDKLYTKVGGSNTYCGVIDSINKKTIKVNTESGGSVPLTQNYLFYVKNNVAESYGASGYFLKYEIENDSTDFVEIFSVTSNLFKSYP